MNMETNDLPLIIRVVDGAPFEHPILVENFIQVFPNVDINNLPPEFAKFERVSPPTLAIYEKISTTSYELGPDGIYRDQYTVVPMSGVEIQEKQDFVITSWNADPNSPKSWIFNEETCSFVPPIPYPLSGGNYYWDEDSVSWNTEL